MEQHLNIHRLNCSRKRYSMKPNWRISLGKQASLSLLTGYTPHLAQSALIANSRGAKKKNAPPSELTEDANQGNARVVRERGVRSFFRAALSVF